MLNLHYSFPGAESLMLIYSSILNQHFGNVEYRIPQVASKLADNVIEATIWLHNKVNSVFLPTATKFHYIFNLRDLSNIFQVFKTFRVKNMCDLRVLSFKIEYFM